jgi:Concanavalin A-like lectin/glucanases superfamily
LYDGTNTLFAFKDQGDYGFFNLKGKSTTGDPATCTEGDLYYNATDDTLSICHSGNTWEQLDGGGSGTSGWTDDGNVIRLTTTNDQVAIGTTSAQGKLTVEGAVAGKALVNFNELGDQDVFTASTAGQTRFRISNTGDTYVQKFIDISNSNYYIDPANAGMALSVAGTINSDLGRFSSGVTDSGSAVGFTLNTTNTLTTAGAKLLSLTNNSTEMFSVDKDGNVWAKGSFYADRGFGVQMKNIGSTLAAYDLVVINTTENASDGVPRMSATTSAYAKTAFGVVQTTCVNNATCNVVIQGKSLINVADSTNPGDYLFSSATAGKATSGTKQYDGLIGTATSADATDPYQVEMVFLHQPAVEKLRVADKNIQHAMYHEATVDYDATDETNRYTNNDENIRKGLYFDTFSDKIKVDSANLTVGLDTGKKRAGLWGGIALNATNTDTSGNTYLGGADANDVYYYDRTSPKSSTEAGRDSSPQTLVDLGVDPNWFNGVTLTNATSSGQLATAPPANLSTSYNGGLIKVSGRYTASEEDGPILITIRSDNEATASGNPSITFDWKTLDNPGSPAHSGSNVTIDKGVAYTLETGTTDVSVTFTQTQYHAGDLFRIASWYLEPATANDRGSKQAFPLHANLVAGDSYVDILDSDTNKLWMRFAQGTNYALGVDTNNDPSSVHMLNGKLYVSTNGSASTGLYEIDFTNGAIYRYNATARFTHISPKGISDRNTAVTNAYHNDVSNTSLAIADAAVNDVHAAVVPNQPTQEITVSGWGYQTALGDTGQILNEQVNLPYKFTNIPQITVSSGGLINGSNPNSISDCTINSSVITSVTSPNSSAFTILGYATSAGYTGYRACYTWTATGVVAPQTISAVANDTAINVINESNPSVTAYSETASDDYNQVWVTSGGKVYATNETQAQLEKWNQVATNTTSRAAGTPDKVWDDTATNYPSIANLTVQINPNAPDSLYVTEGTSTNDDISDTVYLSDNQGVAVIQTFDQNASASDGNSDGLGSVKYYKKNYISEEIVGNPGAMYPLNVDQPSSDFEDISVHAYDLTSTNITAADAVSGVRGTAVDFDGATEYLSNTTAISNYMTASSGSISLWVKTSGTPPTNANVYNGELLVGDAGAFYGLYRTIVGGQNCIWAYNWTGSSGSVCIPYENGVWTHVAMVHSGGVLYAYKNGQLVGSTTSGDTNTITGNFRIAYLGASGDYYTGVIDEVMLTKTALTGNQIKRIYETGERALQSHGINDYKNNLSEGGTGNGTDDSVLAVAASGGYMYTATNNTANNNDGYVNKVELASDTVVQTYTASTDPALSDDDASTLSVSPSGLEIVGSGSLGSDGAGGAMVPGLTSQGNDQTGTYYSDTVSLPQNISSAYIWVNQWLDSDCATCSISVSASNDGGATYVGGVLTSTDSNQTLPEKEYLFSFNSPGNSLKVKFDFTRDSSLDANIYIEKYGVTWFNDDDVAQSGSGGLFTNNGTSVANGSYVEVAHNQNTNDIVANGWVYDSVDSRWKSVDESSKIDVGDGTDGALAPSGTFNLNTSTSGSRTYADGIAYKIDPVTATTSGTMIKLYDTPNGLAAGDEVMLINLRGASGDTADVGNYEFLDISSINTTSKEITFTTAIINSYDGTTPSNQKILLQRVPNYTTITLDSSDSITTTAWDGLSPHVSGAVAYYSGIVVLRASDTITVGSGTSITASQKGYRGGIETAYTNIQSPSIALQGEGEPGSGSRSVSANGQGAGGGDSTGASGWNSGGGGGGYAAAGTAGTTGAGHGGGAGGSSAGDATLTTLRFGGAGGAGGEYTAPFSNTGGSGGGIIYIATPKLTVTGTMSANGGAGSTATEYADAGAGGGAGGSIYIASPDVSLGSSLVTASAGSGGTGHSSSGSGGAGSVGRINVKTNSTGAATSPTANMMNFDEVYQIVQIDTNTVRLYNYSGSTQNLRLDVVAGSLSGGGGNGVSLAPSSADVDADANKNSIWINKTDESGKLLRLQNDGVDRFSVGWDGHATVSGNLTINQHLVLSETATPSANANAGTLWVNSTNDDLYFMDKNGNSINLSNTDIGARVYNNANISINNNTITALTFNSERYDTDNIHSTSVNTSRLTAMTAGKYVISGSIEWAALPGTNSLTGIQVNGATWIASTQIATGSIDYRKQNVSTIYNLAAGDYVELSVFQLTGGSLNIQTSGNYSPEFSMTKLGSQAGADVAEWYQTHDDTLAAGDIVSISNAKTVGKSTAPYDTKTIGIVSTLPDTVLGNTDGTTPGYDAAYSYIPKEFRDTMAEPISASPSGINTVPVALSGRVPVKIASSSAQIAAGDYLTASFEPGKAMKATESGRVIGMALENWTPESGKDRILVFVNPMFYETPMNLTLSDGGSLLSNGQPVQITNHGASYTLETISGQAINKLGAFSQAIIGNLTAGSITSQSIISPIAQFDEVKVETISPISTESAGIAVKLGDGQTFGVYTEEGTPAATFDSEGNATLTGELRAAKIHLEGERSSHLPGDAALEVEGDASISGTLYADRIMTRFGELTSSPSAIINKITIQQFANATPSAEASISALLALGADVDDANVMIEKDYTFTEGVSILGDTMLGNTTITGSILANAIHLDNNSIETFSDTLYLQKSRLASLDIMGGTIVVTNTGDVLINGNVDITGNLNVHGVLGVSTLSTLSDLSIQFKASPSAFAKLLIKDSDNRVVASIDASGSAKFLGNIEASGSGTFTKVNIATGQESTASASIGQGLLRVSQTSVTIYNSSVTADSLIFITPTTVTDRILSVVDKTLGSFTVGTTSAPSIDIKFNYWVIN